MAPKGMKRPAAAAAGGASKRAAKDTHAKEAAAHCAVVCKELLSAEGPLPPTVFAMLSNMLPEALLTYHEERHEFQVTAITMASSAMASIEAQMKAAIETLEAKVAGEGQDEAAKKEAQAAAQADLDAKKADVPVKKEASEAGKTAFGAASGVLVAAYKAQKDGDVEAEKSIASLTSLQSFCDAALVGLKAGGMPSKDFKAGIKTFEQLAKGFGFDAELVKAASITLSTAPESRGTFDTMILGELEKLIGGQLETLKAEIAAAEPAKGARAKAVEAAQAALVAAEESMKALAAELTAAQAAEVEAAAALKAAAAAVKGFASEVADTRKACQAAKDTLTAFQSKPLHYFTELQAYSKPLPPPPVEEEPAPAAEPEPVPVAEPSVFGPPPSR